MDRFELYELCVQSPQALAGFLRAAHGKAPLALREDFCGRAAISQAWLALDPRATALAVDSDPRTLGGVSDPRLERSIADVTRLSDDGRRFDVVHAGNFSLGYLKTRCELLSYFELVRQRLAPAGVFVADTFGGASAFQLGSMERRRFLPDGRRVSCLWQRREADPARGTLLNTLSFRVDRDGEIELELADAFEYRWRLWSLPELSDACAQVGFQELEFYDRVDEGDPVQVQGPQLAVDFTVCIVARR